MHVVCIRMLLSASICLSTLQKHEGGFVLSLNLHGVFCPRYTFGRGSTLYFWAWSVLSAFKKTCGGFCPPITKWTWGVLSVGCFILHSNVNGTNLGLESKCQKVIVNGEAHCFLWGPHILFAQVFKNS